MRPAPIPPFPARMDAPGLRVACSTLMGEDWQRPLARALGPHHPGGARSTIDDRLVRRWASGERPVPEWVRSALVGIAADAVDAQRKRLAAMEGTFAALASASRREEAEEFLDAMMAVHSDPAYL